MSLRMALALLAALLVVHLCAGCATKPPVPECERFEVTRYETPLGYFYVIDQQNMEKLVAQQVGITSGSCTLPGVI